MEMNATVLKVGNCNLLVCDLNTRQEVLVHSPKACCFYVGDRICIQYDGKMTMSIPPQIYAINIIRLPDCACR